MMSLGSQNDVGEVLKMMSVWFQNDVDVPPS